MTAASALRSWSYYHSVPNPVHSRLHDIGPRLRLHHHVVAMQHRSSKQHTASRQNRRCYHLRLCRQLRFRLSCLRYRCICLRMCLRSATGNQQRQESSHRSPSAYVRFGLSILTWHPSKAPSKTVHSDSPSMRDGRIDCTGAGKSCLQGTVEATVSMQVAEARAVLQEAFISDRVSPSRQAPPPWMYCITAVNRFRVGKEGSMPKASVRKAPIGWCE